ncbi:synergin gamma isoform X1 [Anguilla anguilla]|uniref:synergin gamma isoform X1 n=1 Tax=Anguilla anguilla TaxID=7936 RepID=UPI0015A76443|nr:synergin gamma isoform X1 [Anguilla anguilla]
MALRPGTGGAGSFMYPVGGGLGPSQGVPMQPQQPQQGFPMVPVMPPNMQGIVGMNFGAQLPPGAMQMQGGMAMGMQMMGQPQFMGLRAPGPHYTADMQKQMVEDRQKHMEQHQRMLEEERKRRQFEEQKQKLRMLSSIKPKMGEKSRDDALEAIRGNLDGFSRDARMHPSASSHPKNPDSSSSHSSVTLHPPPPAFPEDDDDFSDFIQGPSAPAPAPAPAPPVPSSSPSLRAGAGHWPVVDGGPGQRPKSAPRPQILSHSMPFPPASQPSTVTSSSQSAAKGVGVFPQQEHIQPMAPSWLYNDSLVPDLYRQVLEFTMTPAGIDTGKLYPILMSSGLPREALGQIWATANRTTPGKLTKEELYTVLAMIGVTQNGLPASLDVLSQFPSPPLPNLPAVAMVLRQHQHQHQQPSMPQPPVPMVMPAAMAPAMGMTLPAPAMAPSTATQPTAGFVTNFPPAQEAKPEDDDFQDFQEAPKAGSGDVSFADFQGETGGSFSCLAPSQPQSSAPPMLMPVSGASSSSSSDRYAAFKQMTVGPAPSLPTASDPGDKYSIFRQLDHSADQKCVGEGSEDFSSPAADDGFTSFKTADSVSPLDPPSQAKIFQPAFPPSSPQCPSHSLPQQPHMSPLPQPKATSLSVADLDLFSSLAPGPAPAPAASAEATPPAHPSAPPPLAAPPGGGVRPHAGGMGNFGDFALFGSMPSSSSSSVMGVAPLGDGVAQDDFADFAAFGGSGALEGEAQVGGSGVGGVAGLVGTPPRQRSSDKYDVFKQLSLELSKESGAGSLSSLRSDGDDLADFPPSRLCASLTASDRSLAGRAKEDCASVKSLDLPSIGGSSAGREDSEDALSMQLDMKLSDLGGDLKHVMSDSSLDLPSLSAPPPPAAEADDLKFDPFGTSVASGAVGYDWPDKEDSSASHGAKVPAGPSAAPSKESVGTSDSAATHASPAKPAVLPTKDGPPGNANFEAFADFVSFNEGGAGGDDEFGDFAVIVAEKPDSPRPPADPSLDGAQGEVTDEFGAFQGDKPKFGKFDFLKASSQAKVRSSEEMIQSELATFDLSVQDSQKRSHSLGDKEMGRSTPSPAPEQPHRDRSNTLSDKPTLPVIRDKYKDLTGEVEESERYAYEWQRCLESALQVISKANNTLNSISSSAICTEVIQSAQGMEYLLGVVEVYRVTKRVELGIKATAVCSDKLQELLKDVSRVWNNLMGFMSLAKVTPDESSLDFSSCILRPGIKNAKELACGVCLLNVDSRSKAFNSETDNFKLFYGGHQYHASCANFWINCVEPKPPGLILPDLL